MFNNIQPRTQGLITATRHAPHAHCERHWFWWRFRLVTWLPESGCWQNITRERTHGFYLPYTNQSNHVPINYSYIVLQVFVVNKKYFS